MKERADDTDCSEISSNLSHEYARERSRQVICKMTFDNVLQNVCRYQKLEEEEEYDLRRHRVRPVAEWFINKLIGRVDRIMDGEMIGDMVDSELENL